MEYVKQVNVACPVCAAYNVHLELYIKAENVTYGLPGDQVKLSAKLSDLPVLRCYEVSVDPETYGMPCSWTLEGEIDADGMAVFQNPVQP